MSALPTISIVTPSFNQADFLEETIQSVLSQNYRRLEYVVIDGGSTDGSVEIIKNYSKHLHYWVSEEDDGHGHALNKGFAHTSGDILAWINSDDRYMPWTFDVVGEIFALFPHVDWIVGFNSWWSSKGFLTSAVRNPKNVYDVLLGNYQWIQQESVFWRRGLWEAAGGRVNQDLNFMVDGDLWCRFFLLDELYSVDCILSGYRLHSTNRAKAPYVQCRAEMERAIAAMKRQCPQNVLQTYSTLNAVNRIKKAALLDYLPVATLARKLMPATFGKASYKNLFFEAGLWRERHLPFSL